MQALILLGDPQQPLLGTSALLEPKYCRYVPGDTFFTGIYAFSPFNVCLVTKRLSAMPQFAASSAEAYLSNCGHR